jgi:hypothetical protein
VRGGLAGATADPARATALAQQACKIAGAGSPACLRVACDGGALPSCVALGTAYALNKGAWADDEMIMQLDQQACDGSDFDGCSELGYQKEHNTAFTPDLPAARALYQKACEGNDPMGCKNYGYVWYVGVGGEQNLEESLEWFTKACSLKLDVGCKAQHEAEQAIEGEKEMGRGKKKR